MNNIESIIPVSSPTATSTNVTMEMITGSVEKDDNGVIKVNRFVKFTTENGHHILYPWEALKETVLGWVNIEKKTLAPRVSLMKRKKEELNLSPKKPANICPGWSYSDGRENRDDGTWICHRCGDEGEP